MRLIMLSILVLTLVGCKTHIPVRSQIDIDAPIERVYQTLITFEDYPDWNPYHIRVRGRPETGAALEIRVQRPDGKIIDVPGVHIMRIRENAELTWGGGIPGVFYGEHVFTLRSIEHGRTRLTHNEDFSGIFIGFADLPQDIITQGYNQMNNALKVYLELQ